VPEVLKQDPASKRIAYPSGWDVASLAYAVRCDKRRKKLTRMAAATKIAAFFEFEP
jgi:hypothetical protein